jgi:glyoxylase-like metal-dependent hydrolase (beta-lactamase superfamily II)
VHRIPLPLNDAALRTVNVYAIEDAGGLTLIDAGIRTDDAYRALVSGVADIGAELGDIHRVLVTHLHDDHYTLGLRLRDEAGSALCLGRDEEPSLRAVLDRHRDPLTNQRDLLEASGASEVVELLVRAGLVGANRAWPNYGLPDVWLTPGLEIELADRALVCHSTPGHTYGHLVFHDPQAGLLFAGDHVLSHITPSLAFESVVPKQPLRHYLASLAKVRAFADAQLLPAHGPVTASVHARVDELIEHHRARLAASLAAAAESSTAYQVAQRLRWTRRDRQLHELDPMNQSLAVLETKAHLDLLAWRGEISVVVDAGVNHYLAATCATYESDLEENDGVQPVGKGS